MAAGHNDPKLLYAIEGINAYHIADGKQRSLTASGPQTLSLLMVPAAFGLVDNSDVAAGEEDFYLHLHLPPELDLPLPATTQIYHQPPSSYLIPRWDLGPNSGAFTRIEFPKAGSRKHLQEDVDTFETILAQCTAFLERAQPPKPALSEKASLSEKSELAERSSKSEKSTRSSISKRYTDEKLPPYNPAEYDPGEAYVQGSSSSSQHGGRLVLVDEEDGSVIGELSEGMIVDDGAIKPGSKDPVQISIPDTVGQKIQVQPATQQDLLESIHPAYRKSTLVNSATKASRFLVTTSDYVNRAVQTRADTFTKTTEPAANPMTFTPTTHAHIRRINQYSAQAAGISKGVTTAAMGSISKLSQSIGAAAGVRKDGRARGYDKDGKLIESYKPGILNKSLMAFNTVVDGAEKAGQNLFQGTTTSVNQVVDHKFGPDVGEASRNIFGGVKNVGLVYIDVTGVSRRAILKSVARGMVVGKFKGGGQVIVNQEEKTT